MTLRQLINELEVMAVTLPDDSPVNVWLLAEVPGPLTLAALDVTGVCGGFDKRTQQACATLKLSAPVER